MISAIFQVPSKLLKNASIIEDREINLTGEGIKRTPSINTQQVPKRLGSREDPLQL